MLHDHIIGTVLKELKIDLDDDLYLYYYNKNDMFIKLWEFYEIHETIPRKKLFYGNWTLSHGLKLIDQEKWIRRRDLQGASLRLMSGNWGVFTQMTPIKENLFEFIGMYPEFLFNFQVSKYFGFGILMLQNSLAANTYSYLPIFQFIYI